MLRLAEQELDLDITQGLIRSAQDLSLLMELARKQMQSQLLPR